MRRAAVVGTLVVLLLMLSGCGGAEGKRTESGNVLHGPPPTETGEEPSSLLVELDNGVQEIELMTSFERVDCFDDTFVHGNEPDSWVTAGDSGCIEDRAWHLEMATGGEPGSVDWTLIIGVLRPQVDQVTIISESGAVHRPATRPAPVGDWLVFTQRLDEGVRRLEAHAASGELLESVTVPHQLRGTCGWVCRGQGPWQKGLSPWLERGLEPLEPDPHEAIVEADERLRELFAGTEFDLWPPQTWTGCAGIERGATWIFSPHERKVLNAGEWPTLNSRGRPITWTSTEPPEGVVVDIDILQRKVVSILPYDPVGWAGPRSADAPFAGNVCREVP